MAAPDGTFALVGESKPGSASLTMSLDAQRKRAAAAQRAEGQPQRLRSDLKQKRRKKRVRFAGEDAVDDPRADVAPSFPPAALLDDHAALLDDHALSASASGSAPASGSAGSCAEEAHMKKLCDRWAEARMKQLCVELDELRPLPPEIRKRKLRDLQRELHPDMLHVVAVIA